MSAEASGPVGSLREQAILSARWVALTRLICESTAFAAMIALARLLTPADVGHAALAMITFALAGGLISGSFGSPLIREKKLRDAHVEVAYFLSIATGLGLTLFSCALGLLLRNVLSGDAANMVLLASPVFLFASVSCVPQALRARRLAFKALGVIEVVSTVSGAACSVLLAALGAGPAAMVGGALATAAVMTVMSPYRAGLRRPRWHGAEAREILRFGLAASASSLLYTAIRNIDYAIISGRLPATQVGLYYRAFTLAVDYQAKISMIVVRILFPVLSRAESSTQFHAARGRIIRLHTVVLFPLLGILLITAPDVIPFVFGDRWTGAVVPTQILVGAGIVTTIGTGIGPMMMAAGKPRALVVFSITFLLGYSTTIYACSAHGVIATCIGVVAYQFMGLVASQYFLASRLLGIPLNHTLIRDPGPAAVATAGLLLVGFGIARATEGYAPAITIASTLVGGFVTYLTMLRVLFPATWSDVQMTLTSGLPRRFAESRRGSVSEPLSEQSEATLGDGAIPLP